MEAFNAWWGGLATINQWFFIAAAFFSVFFVWQLIMAIVGLGGGEAALDTHVDDATSHDTSADADQTVVAFKLLSVRSILTFCTLFSWAGAMYMSHGVAITTSMLYALGWGLAAMFLVSLIFHAMRKLTETGNQDMRTCIGSMAMVYLDIPAGGVGEVQVMCSGRMTNLRARSVSGNAIKAGTQVRVRGIAAGLNTLDVDVEAKG